jgi:hypothetical protein
VDRPGFAFSAYSPEGGDPELVKSGVLFLDVLGVEAATRSEDRLDYLRRLRDALEEARSVVGIDDQVLHSRALFSDSLIAAFPLTGPLDIEETIGPAEVMAARLQLELVDRGFFLRGGLSFGEHYMDEDFAFGPALVEAVQLERRAVVPRVVLSAEAASAERTALKRFYGGRESPQRQYLLTDAQGVTFVSYLDVVVDIAEDDDQARTWFDRHRAVVCEKLDEHAGQAAVESKYLWTARYHNYVCRHRAPEALGQEFLIDLDIHPAGLESFAADLPLPPDTLTDDYSYGV